MPLVSCSIAIAAVAVICLLWRSYETTLLHRRRKLRERVAYMLWVMADPEEPDREDRYQTVDSSPDLA